MESQKASDSQSNSEQKEQRTKKRTNTIPAIRLYHRYTGTNYKSMKYNKRPICKCFIYGHLTYKTKTQNEEKTTVYHSSWWCEPGRAEPKIEAN